MVMLLAVIYLLPDAQANPIEANPKVWGRLLRYKRTKIVGRTVGSGAKKS